MITGLIISTIYASIGLINQTVINHRWESYYQHQQIPITNLNSKTTAFNNILWATMAETDSHFLIGYSSILKKTLSPVYRIEKKQTGLKSSIKIPKYKHLFELQKTHTRSHMILRKKPSLCMTGALGNPKDEETGKGNAIFNYIIDYSQDPLKITTYSPREINYKEVFKHYPQFFKRKFSNKVVNYATLLGMIKSLFSKKKNSKLTIVIAGGTGLIGQALHKHFKDSANIIILSTRQNKHCIHWNPNAILQDNDISEDLTQTIQNCNVLINLAGYSVGKGRFSKKHKS